MHKWRPGDYLIIDDSSGLTHWASECGYDWDGSIRHMDNMDGMHPEYMRRNYPLEKLPRMVNAPQPVSAYVQSLPIFVGETNVTAVDPIAPARFIV